MTVDAVVVARNEAATIGEVIAALRNTPGIGQVIVVDDQSSDHTAFAARLGTAWVVRGQRRGKGEAMTTGLAEVRTERVLFADADVRGFTSDHALKLVTPQTGMITGLRDNGSVYLGPIPPVSGERCLPVSIARSAHLHGYSAELALDAAAGYAGIECATVRMAGVHNPVRSFPRVSLILAVIAYLPGLVLYMLSWLLTFAARFTHRRAA